MSCSTSRLIRGLTGPPTRVARERGRIVEQNRAELRAEPWQEQRQRTVDRQRAMERDTPVSRPLSLPDDADWVSRRRPGPLLSVEQGRRMRAR